MQSAHGKFLSADDGGNTRAGSGGMPDWSTFVPEPQWKSLRAPAEQISALGLGPDYVRARAYFQLAEALFRRTSASERDAAAWSYVAAHRLRPLAAAYVNLGVVLHQSGRYDAARA